MWCLSEEEIALWMSPGELPNHQMVLDHLMRCRSCRAKYRTIREVQDALGESDAVVVALEKRVQLSKGNSEERVERLLDRLAQSDVERAEVFVQLAALDLVGLRSGDEAPIYQPTLSSLDSKPPEFGSWLVGTKRRRG